MGVGEVATVSQGAYANVELLPGQSLTVTADSVSSGIVRFVGLHSSDGAASAPAITDTINLVNATRTLGPFLMRRRYRLEPAAGSFSYSVDDELSSFSFRQRPLGYTALLGDSRVAQIFTSASNAYSISGYNHFSWGNARSGKRLTVCYAGGVSGDRTDQMLARLSAAIASGAGHLYMQAAVNDISQSATGYTTVNTVGPNQGVSVNSSNVAAIAFANIQYAALQFLASGGQKVTVCLECGTEAFSTTQIGAVIDVNQSIREMAESVRGIGMFDAWTEMHDPSASSTTTIRFKSGYAQESAGSGVHQSNLGGYMLGIPFAAYITANFPPVPYLPSDVQELPALSLRNQLANPLFMTTSGGAGSGAGGISGTVPGSWTVDRSGGGGTQTAVVSTGTPADGSPGKECILACTFGGAGDLIRLRQDAVNANWNVGDVVQGVASCVIDSGATSLAGVFMDMQQNDGALTTDVRDLFPLNNVAIGTDGCTLFLKTQPFLITGKSGSPFMTMRLYAQGSGPGTATVRWRQVQIRKRFSA